MTDRKQPAPSSDGKPRVRVKAQATRQQVLRKQGGRTLNLGSQVQGVRAMYEAAGGGRRSETFVGATGYTANYELGRSLDLIQKRVGYEIRNNPIAARILDVVTRTTAGLRGPQPKFRDPELRRLWKRFEKRCDANGRLSWGSMVSLAMRETAGAGEVFAWTRERSLDDVERGMAAVPFQVQLIPSARVPLAKPHVLDLNLEPGAEYRHGIVFRGPGQRDAYVILKRHPRDGDPTGLTRDDFVIVPAEAVLHVYQEREPGQLRGEPWLVRSLTRLHELDQYMDAELVKKQFAAKMTTFYKAPQTTTSGADVITDASGEVEEVEDEFIPGRIDAGAAVTVPPGWQIETPRAHEVGGDFQVFVRQTLMEACAAAHAPYELVTGDFSQTPERVLRYYNKTVYEPVLAARRAMLEDSFCGPIAYRFVQEAFNAGLWTPPAGETWEDHAEPEWAWTPIPHPNPAQEIGAMRQAIATGVQSISGAIRELGRDPDEVAREMREDLERFDGLPIEAVMKAAAGRREEN